MTYENPGIRFLKENGLVTDRDGVLKYADFLRQQAGLEVTPPIDLSRIYAHFGISPVIREDLGNVQGMLIDPSRGIILVNEKDPALRQRFTEAHELMELLFSQMPASVHGRVGPFSHTAKERLCDEGAAELLMPSASFDPLVSSGLSFRVAREVAEQFNVSTTASLVTAVRRSTLRQAVVQWRMKQKPTQIRNTPSKHQISLFDNADGEAVDTRKLRVEWSFRSQTCPYIPENQSVPEDSTVYRAYTTAEFAAGVECIRLGNLVCNVSIESHSFGAEDDRGVVSLIKFQ